MIAQVAKDHDLIVTMEENVASGAYGAKVLEYVSLNNLSAKVLPITLPDAYIEHGNVDLLRKEVGTDAGSVVSKILEAMK